VIPIVVVTTLLADVGYLIVIGVREIEKRYSTGV
jgi:hypothetical protein